MTTTGIGRRLSKLENHWKADMERADEGRRALLEAERLVREANRMAAEGRKPVKDEHSLDLAVAFLLVAGEDRHREVLASVVREDDERYERIRQTGVWIAGTKWWDQREVFRDWVWRAVERCSGETRPDPGHAAGQLSKLRAGVNAFSEPIPRDQLGKDGPVVFLIAKHVLEDIPAPEA